MTKQEYIDTLHELLGDKKYTIPKQICEVALNSAYLQVCSDLIRMRRKDVDFCRKRFSGIAVTWDSSRGVYYSNWPAAIIPDLDMEKVVNMIQGSGYRFQITTEKALFLFENLPENDLNTKIKYLPKRDVIEYYNMESLSDDEIADGATPTPKVATVRMNPAIQFREFDADDEVYMPMAEDDQVIQLALSLIKEEPVAELRNN